MKYFILILLLFVPLFVFADTPTTGGYKDLGGMSQMIADSFKEVFDFFFSDIPSLFDRIFKYAYEFAFKIKLWFIEKSIKASWAIATDLIASFQIMSTITASISSLSPDVSQAFVEMRLFDGINLLIQAHVTRFVLRT